MAKTDDENAAKPDAPTPHRSVAIIGSGPTSRAIKRFLADEADRHVVQVGLEFAPGTDLPCALSAEIARCEELVYVPNFDDLELALAAGRGRREALLNLTQTVLDAARLAEIRHVVVITSAMVYGAQANRVPVADETPVAAEPDEGIVGDALAIEALIEAAECEVTVLRPAAVVGSGVDTAPVRHFAAPRILVLRGVPIAWQFVHVDDVASAVGHVLDHRLLGPVAVGAPGTLNQDDIETLSRMGHVEIPESLALILAQRLYRVGALPMPPTDLLYVTRSWAVESNRLRDSGWNARYDNAQCFRELLAESGKFHAVAGRRLAGKDAAALGVAGAAVALLGTAVAWRRARGNWRR